MPGKKPVSDETGRMCTRCATFKPWDEFSKQSSGYNGRKARCRSCMTQVKYEWIEKNRERHEAYAAEYRKQDKFRESVRRSYWKHRDRRLAQAKKYRLENLAELRERERQEAARRRASRTPAQRAKVNEWNRNRYYAKKAGGVFTDMEWEKLLNRFGGVCAYCQVAPAEHREHVIPVSRGGKNTVGNILPACATYNLSKRAMTLVEWRASGRAPEAIRPLVRRAR